ncbi:spore germination protein [Paenibacillus radicis (ex Xue et al. 2023)]|uniref:Spore germination protein n=1 Tax=Paenibacillus radicis (ex Xue et al. 2023) TaxID=2972489 RepID=A0ABT1YAG8_9BACL|nr:spore germination protein [Paenibacillus radicis (ex Xue et al. 2023)]MCR8630190.1 spore germination protein [Paenibacillus radicis (ex Xue et al. 2023)]
MKSLSRYFFYALILTMMINSILYVPRILINERYEGALMSLILGTLIGSILLYIFTGSLLKFPGMGLPEIFKLSLHKSIYIPSLLILGTSGFIAGGLVLINFTFIISRYLNPETPSYILLLLFVFVVGFGAMQSSKTVLYCAEIVLILSVPLLLFLIIKALTNKHMSYDAVKVILDYTWMFASWKSLTVSTYAFVGYLTLSIFNRTFSNSTDIKYRWLIPIFGFGMLLSTFIIPIGTLGTDGVNDYIFTWVSTAEAIQMKYAFIDHVVYIFLLIFLAITFLYTMVTWHIASETISSCFPRSSPNTSSVTTVLPNAISCGLMGIATIVTGSLLGEDDLFRVSSFWMTIRLPIDVFIVLTVYVLSKRRPIL